MTLRLHFFVAVLIDSGFPLRNCFIPGCVGSGLDLDLRVRRAAPAWQRLEICDFSKPFFVQEFKQRDLDMFPNLKCLKFDDLSIQNELMLSSTASRRAKLKDV